MSSQSRSRDYEISRSSPYVSKSREVDGRKRDAYTSRGDGGTVSEKHRSAPYSSKSSRRSIDDRKDPYISSSERRDPESSKRERDNYSSGASREIYSKVGRDRDYSFESRERERAPFLSRGRSHASRGHRDSYSSHGPRESFHPRGGRDSFGSRGNYGNRGHRDSFSSRGNFGSRESFSRGNYMSVRGNKDYSRGSYGSRGGRDSYSSRGSFGNRGGRDSFSSRGNYFGSRGGRINFSRGARGLGRGFRGSNRGLRSDPFMSHFDSRAQLKLTEKLVASVLEDSEEDFRDEKPYRVKEHKEGRSYNPRESERHFKEPSRSFSHHSSYSHGDKLIKRERSSSSAHFDKERFIYSEKSKMKIKDKFREAPSKRVHEEEEIDEDERPPLKHMRLSKRDKYHDPISSSSHRFEERSSSYSPSRDEHSSHRLFNSKEEEEGRVRRSRERTRKTEKEKRPSESEEVKRSEEREIAEEVESVKVKRKFSRDEELEEEFEESHHRKSSPTGMQVTVRSDGERAVNSKGSVKSRITSRKFFIELQCPHCPEERSYTFRDYKFHLVSHNHKIKIRNLLHKHSIVLRRIRQKQRAEQKEKEDKWEVDNPEEFKTTVSRYCYTCKLAFKCLPADESAEGITEHNASKLHKVQHLYTFPRCDLCGVKPPSRLAYEIHLVSIRHLRMASMSRENRREISEEDHAHDDANIGEREELDLANFITMDSVGEDEEAGSEHEDMLGDPEDIKKAEEEAKEGEDDDEHEEHHGEEDDAEKSHPYDGDDDLELELDHEIGEDLDMSDEEREVCGKEFLVPLEAFYCKLCHKAIRIDTPLGETALDRHCTSSLHIENFHYLNSEEYGEEQRENFDEEQLAEEEEAEEEEEPFCENEEAEPEEPVLIEESDEQGHPEEGSADEDRRVTEEEETDGEEYFDDTTPCVKRRLHDLSREQRKDTALHRLKVSVEESLDSFISLSKRDKYHDPISSSSHRFEERSSSYSPSRDEHSSHRLFNSKEEEEGRVRRSRERTRKTEKEKRPSESEEVKRSEEREIAEEVESVKVKRKFSRDEELEEEFEESHHRKSSPTGMQVTVRSDGERAVNSKGSVKSRITSRKFFIELQCPHCPEERSYTFRDYKFHLVSHNHKIKIRNLLHKHSIVLRRIRQKQRAEQKEKEDKWEVDNPEEFKTTVSRYCYTCKLAFKCLPADESAEGITEHNASKLHKVQHLYTFPRCDLCGVKPPSRLAYEIHLVSIRHLRMASMSRENRREISEEDHAHDDANIGEREELDLANFITMDSVGEDEEAGSEHEDMLGDPEDIKKAEEEAKEGEDDDEHEEHHGEEDDAEKSHPYDGDDDLELELDHEIGEDLDMSDEEREVCGKEFLVPLEAFYCKLCHKAIRIDTPLGETALDRHCTSSLHIENFHYLNSEEYGEEQRENFDEEQLAEEEEAEEEEEPFCENEEAEPEEPVLIEESDEQGHPEEGSADEDRRVTEEEETDGDVTVNGK